MTRFEVDSARVAQASAAARGSANAIRTEVAGMMRHLRDLETSWRGGAAAAFGGVLGEWQSTQQRVDEALDQITRALDAAAQHYAEAESQASRLFLR
jgi:WXG100 family type VII secretion target